jgi:hypothetical protein
VHQRKVTPAQHLVTVAWPEQPAKTHGKVWLEMEQQQQQTQFATTKSETAKPAPSPGKETKQ